MSKHFVYYLILVIIICFGFSLSIFVGTGQKQLQLLLILITAFFYVVWGVLHHIIHHSFSVKIMLEYVAIAVLGISLILFVLNIGV